MNIAHIMGHATISTFSIDDCPVAFSLEKHLPQFIFLMMILTFNYRFRPAVPHCTSRPNHPLCSNLNRRSHDAIDIGKESKAIA